MAALWADTAWLAGQGVMDYSLLVGLDSPNGALVVGIIDFLRQVRKWPSCALRASAALCLQMALSLPMGHSPTCLKSAAALAVAFLHAEEYVVALAFLCLAHVHSCYLMALQ